MVSFCPCCRSIDGARPVPSDDARVDDADRAVGGLNLDREREVQQDVEPAPFFRRASSAAYPRCPDGLLAGLRTRAFSTVASWLPRDGEEAAALEPFEGEVRVRSPVHDVADREEAVAPRLEVDAVEQVLEREHAPVHVADDEVAAGGVPPVLGEGGVGHVSRCSWRFPGGWRRRWWPRWSGYRDSTTTPWRRQEVELSIEPGLPRALSGHSRRGPRLGGCPETRHFVNSGTWRPGGAGGGAVAGGWSGALDVERFAFGGKGCHRLGVALAELGSTLRGVCRHGFDSGVYGAKRRDDPATRPTSAIAAPMMVQASGVMARSCRTGSVPRAGTWPRGRRGGRGFRPGRRLRSRGPRRSRTEPVRVRVVTWAHRAGAWIVSRIGTRAEFLLKSSGRTGAGDELSVVAG